MISVQAALFWFLLLLQELLFRPFEAMGASIQLLKILAPVQIS